jgi:hypothetical protein
MSSTREVAMDQKKTLLLKAEGEAEAAAATPWSG